ncbi:MAG: hypothetical protein ACK41E_08645 [Deinococcales bacterium]
MAWGFIQQLLVWCGLGLLLGGLFTLLAPKVLGLTAPIAWLRLMFWLMAIYAWRWLKYCLHPDVVRLSLGLVVLCVAYCSSRKSVFG